MLHTTISFGENNLEVDKVYDLYSHLWELSAWLIPTAGRLHKCEKDVSKTRISNHYIVPKHYFFLNSHIIISMATAKLYTTCSAVKRTECVSKINTLRSKYFYLLWLLIFHLYLDQKLLTVFSSTSPLSKWQLCMNPKIHCSICITKLPASPLAVNLPNCGSVYQLSVQLTTQTHCKVTQNIWGAPQWSRREKQN